MTKNNSSTYLITGGAGFIGSHLADALLAADHRVLVIDNLSTGRIENINHLMDKPAFHFAHWVSKGYNHVPDIVIDRHS